MKLSYHARPSEQPPSGYWYAVTDDGGYDGDGATPLDALADLVAAMEKQLGEDAQTIREMSWNRGPS